MMNLLRGAAVAALSIAYGFTTTVEAAPVATKAGPVEVESLAKLEHPWGMAYLPDGRLLITEKPGNLRLYADGKLSDQISGVPKVAFKGQGGLLDVAVDPNFAENKFIYLSYADPADPQPTDAKDSPDERLGKNFKADDHQVKGGAVARGRLDGLKLEDVKPIWQQVPKTIGRGHFGGRLVFAPDGKLLITSGERQRFEPAQDFKTNLGTIVRINPDGTIPQDNPFIDRPEMRPDVWAFGARNPLGAAINPKTKELWVNEMGPKGGDELNIIQRGRNYGWPLVAVDGKHYNDASIPLHSAKPELAAPIKHWTPVISPSGMIFYGGDRFADWKGNIFIGGLSSKALIRLTTNENEVTGEEKIDMGRRIRDVIEAPDGAILLLSDGKDGELLRLTPAKAAGK